MSSPTHAPELLLARASRPDALLDGVLVVRWCVLAWLVVLVVFPGADAPTGAAGPWLAAAALLLTGGWTLLLTLRRPAWGTATLVADAAVCALLLLVATAAPGLATVYPVAAALSWGARRGMRGGALVGAALGALFVTAHLVTGLVPGRAEPGLLEVLGNAFSLALAGAGTGLVSTLLQRSAAEVAAAQADRSRAREEAARLAEREEIGRQVHDSVLQVLTLVHKRGREIAGTDPVDPRAVAGLAELAAEQERTLRDLVLRPVLASPAPRPAAGPGAGSGSGPATDARRAPVDLRPRLEDAARRCAADLDVTVGAVGDLHLPAATVAALGAAVDQALGNVVRHAGTRQAWVFAERDGDEVAVSVRDDGCGFVLDEDALRAAGRFGLLRSIRGRVEQLGGRLVVDTAPGRGTELELRVPAHGPGPGDDDGPRA